MNVHRCLIVPAAYQALTQSLCAGLAGEAGAGMLTTGISATGNVPATHYISAGVISEEFAVLMTSANLLHQACVAAKIVVTQQQCADILSASDISTDQPFDAMARLNLQLTRAYDVGDNLHENKAGRQVIANAWVDALEANNIVV